MADWNEVREKALSELSKRNLPKEYQDRLDDELYEIEKQGVIMRWVEYYEDGKKWEDNKNGLVMPWLLGMTPVDPVKQSTEHKWVYQTDFPDIDIDFLPHARDPIKRYASEKYKNVCSVGSWVTYKPKSALQDVARALGEDFREVIKFSKLIPDEFDALTLDDLKRYKEQENDEDKDVRQEAHKEVSRYKPFYDYWERDDKTREIVDSAFRLVGKIKTQGTHAGGLIIADRPIENVVPLSYMGSGANKSWTSQWTEGRSTQLSKLGFVKFDILGLKTLGYVWLAGEHVKNNRNIIIDWSDPDPLANRAGVEIYPDGTRKDIPLDDVKAFEMCNALKTESVFQVETDIQKGIISDGVVRSFNDLVVYNALGRPGPMDSIPEYIRRRDEDPDGWKEGQDERIVKILEDTFGVICFHEDTYVSTSDGNHKKIKGIVPGDSVTCVDLDTKLATNSKVESCGKTVVGKGVKITLDNGYSVIVTPNHKLLTYYGYKEACELDKNDLVAICNKSDDNSISDDLVRLVDLIKFDPNDKIHYVSNTSDKTLENIRRLCQSLGVACKIYPENKICLYSYSGLIIKSDVNDLLYHKIKKIDIVEDKVFYNLSVPPHHNVVVNGIVAKQCYQEQLQATWQSIAGFTVPEAEFARKVIAKKWEDKLPAVEKRWKEGAVREIGKEATEEWWELMKSFGRYAFNKCLSVDTEVEDNKTGEKITIGDLGPGTNLLSYNMDYGEYFNDVVEELIDCGEQEVFEIEFDNGMKYEVTMDHKFLCSDGQFRTVREILENEYDVRQIDNFKRRKESNCKMC